MIELKNVSRNYGKLVAVDRINLIVEEGEVCVLIGPSGCGKSTTLKMINRVIPPSSGDILINGTNNKQANPDQLRRTIGYVIQNIGLFPHMDVEHNIGIVPSLLKWEKGRIEERVRSLLELIGLDAGTYLSKYPAQLSGGEAQRIGVARALAADPPLMLMDEPFGAVDPLNRQILQDEFLNIQKKLKKTVVFVTHDLDEAIRLADKVVIMQSGKIVQHDTPEKILSSPANPFVRDFVGADRSLKKLVRFEAEAIMHPAPAVTISGDPANPHIHDEIKSSSPFLWTVDKDGVLTGWMDCSDGCTSEQIADRITHVRPGDIGIKRYSSLKEALSKMLGQGIKSVPVVDDRNKLLGEITLSDIEAVTEAAG